MEAGPAIRVKNVTFIDDLLGACLYADRPNEAVPWLLILAWCVLVASLSIELLWLLLCKWRSKQRTLELLNTSEKSSDNILNLHLAMLTVVCSAVALMLVMLLLPVQHTDLFSNAVFVGARRLSSALFVSPYKGRVEGQGAGAGMGPIQEQSGRREVREEERGSEPQGRWRR